MQIMDIASQIQVICNRTSTLYFLKLCHDWLVEQSTESSYTTQSYFTHIVHHLKSTKIWSHHWILLRGFPFIICFKLHQPPGIPPQDPTPWICWSDTQNHLVWLQYFSNSSVNRMSKIRLYQSQVTLLCVTRINYMQWSYVDIYYFNNSSVNRMA